MKCLVIHTHAQSVDNFHHLVSAAHEISKHVDGIYIGGPKSEIPPGLKQVWHYPKIKHPSAKDIGLIIQKHHDDYTHILAHSDTYGKDFLPYYCGQTKQPMLSNIQKVINSKTFERAIYAGAAIETIESKHPVKVLTIRGIYFDETIDSPKPKISTNNQSYQQAEPKLIKEAKQSSKLPDLNTANIVVSGGRGFGSKESFDMLYQLALHFNAAIGASRAAVDAGYIGNEHQVGQTGKIIAPQVYWAFGISGAVQHLSGMKDSQTIIAVDKNPDAPIFKIAQYGFVGDLFEVIPKLLEHKSQK